MTISVECGMCGKDLKEPGGILLGPPKGDGTVTKKHLCVVCYDALNAMMAFLAKTASDYTALHKTQTH